MVLVSVPEVLFSAAPPLGASSGPEAAALVEGVSGGTPGERKAAHYHYYSYYKHFSLMIIVREINIITGLVFNIRMCVSV